MQRFMKITDTQDMVEDVMMDVAKAVVSTMGPNGRLALISVGTNKKVTKDGVTVARSIKFEDPFKELINKVITEPAVKTDVECGDGTTTTILLTAELYSLFSQFPGYREQKFIERLGGLLIDELQRMARVVTVGSPELYQMALTSSNGDVELSKVITDIYAQANGKFPEIELKEGVTRADKVVHSDGLPVKMEFSNPSFSATGNGADTDFERYVPLVIDDNLRSMQPDQAVEFFRKLFDKYNFGKDIEGVVIPVLLIARSIDNSLNSLIMQINNVSPKVKFIGVQTNFGGSVGTLLMQDIAIMLGVPFFKTLADTLHQDVKACTVPLTVGSRRSVIRPNDPVTKTRITDRAKEIETELGTYEAGDRFSMRAKFNEQRMRSLLGELVTVFVGGETQSEVKERLDRFEDVGKAVKSALINGILPGVGSAMITAGQFVFGALDEQELLDYPPFQKIVDVMEKITFAQFFLLMKGIVSEDQMLNIKANVIDMDCPEPIRVLNLATGEWGTPAALGIYDTAYASITALKGGLQTAKILANLDSVLLGDKSSAVQIQD